MVGRLVIPNDLDIKRSGEAEVQRLVHNFGGWEKDGQIRLPFAYIGTKSAQNGPVMGFGYNIFSGNDCGCAIKSYKTLSLRPA